MAVNWKDGIWVIVENQKVAKGNWRSYQVIALKNFKTGQLLRERFRVDEQFEQAMLDRRPMEYLYPEGDSFVMMEPSTYEQINIPKDVVGDASVYLAPNIEVQVSTIDGKPVAIELPNVVELKVVDTPPQVKGSTATNQLKDAVCEGGARIKVPPFVENGEIVKVDTRSGEYLGRSQENRH
jgi:elongation factor P